MLSCEFCENLRTSFLQNSSGQLLLHVVSIKAKVSFFFWSERNFYLMVACFPFIDRLVYFQWNRIFVLIRAIFFLKKALFNTAKLQFPLTEFNFPKAQSLEKLYFSSNWKFSWNWTETLFSQFSKVQVTFWSSSFLL